MNNGNHTHISGPNYTGSCIDLTIVSASLTLDCDWVIESDNWRSMATIHLYFFRRRGGIFQNLKINST